MSYRLRWLEEDFKTAAKKFQDQGISKEDVEQYFADFKSLKNQKIQRPEDKDIDQWAKKPWEEFKEFIDSLKTAVTKTHAKRMVKAEGAELVAEDPNWYVYKITTHKACMTYGSGTKWCITTPGGERWEQYAQKNNFYFIISKILPEEDPWHKIALQYGLDGTATYWDAEDREHKEIPSHLNPPKFKPGIPKRDLYVNGKITTVEEIENSKSLIVKGDLDLTGRHISKLPKMLEVERDLILSGTNVTELPENLSVGEDLRLENSKVISLPKGLEVGGNLFLENSKITSLPKDLVVGMRISLGNSGITTFPEGFEVMDGLSLSYTNITSLPKNFSVGRDLDLSNSKVEKLPEGLHVEGSLYLDDSLIKEFPQKMNVNMSVFLGDINIPSIPKGVTVGGTIRGSVGGVVARHATESKEDLYKKYTSYVQKIDDLKKLSTKWSDISEQNNGKSGLVFARKSDKELGESKWTSKTLKNLLITAGQSKGFLNPESPFMKRCKDHQINLLKYSEKMVLEDTKLNLKDIWVLNLLKAKRKVHSLYQQANSIEDSSYSEMQSFLISPEASMVEQIGKVGKDSCIIRVKPKSRSEIRLIVSCLYEDGVIILTDRMYLFDYRKGDFYDKDFLSLLEKKSSKNSSEIQSLIFKKDKFSKEKAKKWAKEHGFKNSKVDEKEETFRLRQKNPGQYKTMRTFDMKDGVKAVVGIKESGKKVVSLYKDRNMTDVPMPRGNPFFKTLTKYKMCEGRMFYIHNESGLYLCWTRNHGGEYEVHTRVGKLGINIAAWEHDGNMKQKDIPPGRTVDLS